MCAVAVIAGLGWYFFGPRAHAPPNCPTEVQRVEVTVHGGYQPDVVRVRQNVPVEVDFDRQESATARPECVFSDLGVNAALPAHSRTIVRLDPARAGSFGFTCGMNMIHGTLVVDPPTSNPTVGRPRRRRRQPERPRKQRGGRGGRAGEGAARGDRRPVPQGDRRRAAHRAVSCSRSWRRRCSAPTGFPAVLLNHWVQLVFGLLVPACPLVMDGRWTFCAAQTPVFLARLRGVRAFGRSGGEAVTHLGLVGRLAVRGGFGHVADPRRLGIAALAVAVLVELRAPEPTVADPRTNRRAGGAASLIVGLS